MLAAAPQRPRIAARIRISPRARTQLAIFGFAYLAYSAARWLTVGDLGAAKAHALWIVHLEDHLGIADEGSVQRALSGTWAIWLLNHLYLAAQLVVSFESSAKPVCAVIVSTRPMPASRGGATGNAA